MSATQKTENLKLPFYTPGDFTSWEDFNTAMEILDNSYGSTHSELTDLTTNVQNNTNAISENTDAIHNLNTEMKLQQSTSAAQQSSINALQTNIVNINQGLTAAQNDISSLQTAIGNIPANITQEISDIKTKNEQQDTSIATAQSEANTATQAAQQAQQEASKIQFQKATGKFFTPTITINGSSYNINLTTGASIITYKGDPEFGHIIGAMNINNIPSDVRINEPEIIITLAKESADVLPPITQSAAVFCILSSVKNQFPAKVQSNSGSVEITFYINQNMSNATISNLIIYF